jgi:hypothetical protein
VVAAQVAELRLEERFCGPPATANGGSAYGAIAELLGGVEVTLRRLPPLGRPLRLRVGDDVAVVHDGDELVAEARPATVGLAVPGTAAPAEARAAAARSPLPGGELWAAPWTPDPSVADQDGLVVPRWSGRRWTVPAGSRPASATP